LTREDQRKEEEAPQIDITLVENTEKPGGIAEPSAALIGPAVADAVFAATGKRLPKLPLTAENPASTYAWQYRGKARPRARFFLELLDPRHLYRLEDLLAGFVPGVGKTLQLAHPAVQVGKADRSRIHVRVCIVQRLRNRDRVGPMQRSRTHPASFTFPPSPG